MQNIINFDNSIIRNGKVMLDVSDAIRDKQVSIGTIYELLGYAENEENIKIIRRTMENMRAGKIVPAGQKQVPIRSERWYKSHYNTYKEKNDALLRSAMLTMRELGLTNPEICKKTGCNNVRVNALIGATPKEMFAEKRAKVKEDRKAKMQAMQDAGMNKREIAKALGVSTATVCNTLGKYSDEKRIEILRNNMRKCHIARDISPKIRGDLHWSRRAKKRRVDQLGPMVDNMQKANIPYAQISVVLGFSEKTLRRYRKAYLSETHHDL